MLSPSLVILTPNAAKRKNPGITQGKLREASQYFFEKKCRDPSRVYREPLRGACPELIRYAQDRSKRSESAQDDRYRLCLCSFVRPHWRRCLASCNGPKLSNHALSALVDQINFAGRFKESDTLAK